MVRFSRILVVSVFTKNRTEHWFQCGKSPITPNAPVGVPTEQLAAAGDNSWETIETTIVYNGSQQSYRGTAADASGTAPSTPHVIDSIEIITDEGTFDQFWQVHWHKNQACFLDILAVVNQFTGFSPNSFFLVNKNILSSSIFPIIRVIEIRLIKRD